MDVERPLSTADHRNVNVAHRPENSDAAGGADGRIDQRQFAAMFEQAAPTMWCIAVAIVSDREAARDIVQEAAIIGLAKLEEFRSGTSFVHWMGQIVRFVALNEARKRRRHAASAADLRRAPARGDAAGASPDGRWSVDPTALDAAVAALEETPRACLLLRTVVGMSYSQISQALGIPEGTAMSHVHRARASVRLRLGVDAPSVVKGGRSA